MSYVPRKIHEEVLSASGSGDLNPLVALFSDDSVIMPPNDTDVYGCEEIRAWWEEYFEFFIVKSAVESEEEVTVAGDQAFVRASFSATIVPKAGGPTIHDEIRSLTVWRRQPDGTWKISHQIWNSTKPVGSGTNRYMTRMLQKKGSRSSS